MHIYILYTDIYIYIYICIHIYVNTENGHFRLFAANGNGKWNYVFIGRQEINGNRRLLFQPTCPSIRIFVTYVLRIY